MGLPPLGARTRQRSCAATAHPPEPGDPRGSWHRGIYAGLNPGRALIPHHGGVDDPEAFARLARTVYVTARAGAVDCTAAFDLAASKLEVSPLDQDAGELARLSLDCAEASQARMAEVALSLLAAVGFDPGFTEEPGWLACLQDAMRLVNLDVAATGIRWPCQLRAHDEEPGNAYVETGDGYTGTAQGIMPSRQSRSSQARAASVTGVRRLLLRLGRVLPRRRDRRQGHHLRAGPHSRPPGPATGVELTR
jgi:hypothetical protein